GDPTSRSQDAAERESRSTAARVRSVALPRLLRAAVDRGWWDPRTARIGSSSTASNPSSLTSDASPTITTVDRAAWDRLALAGRVITPARICAAHSLIAAALGGGARVVAAVTGSLVVGLAVALPDADGGGAELLAVGVAPGWRRSGLATRLLADQVSAAAPLRATVGVAERDVFEPLDHALRIDIARRLLLRAGFEVTPASDAIGRIDPRASSAVRR
ncbi:MAG: GNAT family N-acetyltransferase, partial [Candidatus Limnocylindrales bacterium]